MAQKIAPHLIDLVRDALLKSFWYKRSLKQFLRRMHIAESFLATLEETETKWAWLDRLFPQLEKATKGAAVLSEMADALADQTSFPDLVKCEDASLKIEAAEVAVLALKKYLSKKKKEQDDQAAAEDRRQYARVQQSKKLRSFAELEKLKVRFDALLLQVGTQQAGYDFQTWFYDLMDYFDVDSRRPYVSDGRQIDGSVSIDGTTYLVELKFTREQSGGPDIDPLVTKINSKADNTMGIMVSISGYSSVAISGASIARSPLLLIDYQHFYYILMGSGTFPEVIKRIRRHSSQEGKAYLPVEKFGG